MEVWGSALLAFVLTLVGQHLVTPFAPRLGMLDHPAGRKDHSAPTPTIGGIAMLAGVLVAGLVFAGSGGMPSLGFQLAAIVVILVGMLDDKYDVPWQARIGAQALAALIMIYVGGIRVQQLGDIVDLPPGSLGLMSVPFTVFITIGVINAVNMIDGSDGLAGTLVLCALCMIEAAALYSGDGSVSQRVPLLIGAVAAFLVYNLRTPWRPRARIFMGNAGSAFLGLAIACFVVKLTQNPAHPVSPVLGPWLIAVPIIDCLVLMIRRVREGRSPFSADRNHIHHLMQEAGFTPTQSALWLSAFSCTCGLFAAVLLRFHVRHVILVTLFICIGGAWYWVSANRARAVGLLSKLRHPFASRAAQVEAAYVKPREMDGEIS